MGFLLFLILWAFLRKFNRDELLLNSEWGFEVCIFIVGLILVFGSKLFKSVSHACSLILRGVSDDGNWERAGVFLVTALVFEKVLLKLGEIKVGVL